MLNELREEWVIVFVWLRDFDEDMSFLGMFRKGKIFWE